MVHSASDQPAVFSAPHPAAVAHRGRGFTLIELLAVIAIIGILASIVISVGRGVGERARIARAKVELAVLASALEQYKQQYGDYPWTPVALPTGITDPSWDGGAIIFNALGGNLGPKANAPLPAKGRTFVELAKFSLDSNADANLPDPAATTLRLNWFNDPWGNWYYYHYKKGLSDTDWKSPGFILYSHGPDGFCTIGDVAKYGLLENLPTDATSKANNADNIYAGQN